MSNHPYPLVYAHFLKGARTNSTRMVRKSLQQEGLSADDLAWGLRQACENGATDVALVILAHVPNPFLTTFSHFGNSLQVAYTHDTTTGDAVAQMVMEGVGVQQLERVFWTCVDHKRTDLMEDILERAGATAVAQWAKTDPQTRARGKHKEFFQKVTLLAAVDSAPDTAKRTQTPRKL